MMKKTAAILIINLALALASCASIDTGKDNGQIGSFLEKIHGDTVVPRSANTIYIPPFLNDSQRMELPDRLAFRLGQIIISEGRLAVVESGEAADILLQGRILQYQVQTLSFNKFGIPEKKRLLMKVSARLIDRRKGRIILNDESIQSFAEYSEILPPVSTEAMAADTVLDGLARRLHSKIISGWYTDEMTNIAKGKKP
jgi:hypothetical protein